MIATIYQSYSAIFLGFILLTLAIVVIGYLALHTLWRTQPVNILSTPSVLEEVNSQDVKAIAGDDQLATQLDLARAYIETGRLALARKMLTQVLAKANATQAAEANHLLDLLAVKCKLN